MGSNLYLLHLALRGNRSEVLSCEKRDSPACDL